MLVSRLVMGRRYPSRLDQNAPKMGTLYGHVPGGGQEHRHPAPGLTLSNPVGAFRFSRQIANISTSGTALSTDPDPHSASTGVDVAHVTEFPLLPAE